MIVNLLTEDNLPSYHREIATRFGRDGAWGQWVGRWTAEEGRHGIALRDYLVVTRGVDPVELENLRMEHMTAGYDSGDKTMLQASRTSRSRNWRPGCRTATPGEATGCPLAEQLLGPDRDGREPAHDLLSQPDGRRLRDRRRTPPWRPSATRSSASQMPGAGMTDYTRNAVTIAKAGIYDLRLHHDAVLAPVLKFWRVFERTDFGPAGEQAREELSAFLEGLQAQAAKFVESRDRANARAAARA